MKRIGLLFGFLLMVMMLGGWSSYPPASGLLSSSAAGQYVEAAATGLPKLTITNSTGAAFWLTVTGPKTYTFQVVTGKNVFNVEQGEYTLSYFACGAQQTQDVNVKKNGKSLKIECQTPKAGKSPKLTIDNKAGPVYITLTGTKSYSFYAPTGKTQFDVEQGVYEISYYACGAQNTYEINIKKKGGTIKLQCIAIEVVNLTGGFLNLTLDGPAEYYFYLPQGETTINIAPGTYSYSVSADCGTDAGTVNIKKKDTWIWFCY